MNAWEGKRLVIFGCGYVGTALALQGLARGLAVTALTRNAGNAHGLRELGVTTVVAELAAPDWHATIPGGADFVVNCVSSGGGGLDGYRRSYLDGMESIVAWARTTGPTGVMVYTSSTSVYPQDGGVRVDETSPTAGAGERGQVLLAAEARLREARGAWRRWCILRLAGIYGPGRHHLLEQVRTGEVAGRGEHRLNLIHRDDIVAAIWAALDRGADGPAGIFNLADDGAAPKAEVAAWLATQLGVSGPRFTGEPAGGRRAVTPDRVIDNAAAKRVLGWSPRYCTYREGYAALLRG